MVSRGGSAAHELHGHFSLVAGTLHGMPECCIVMSMNFRDAFHAFRISFVAGIIRTSYWPRSSCSGCIVLEISPLPGAEVPLRQHGSQWLQQDRLCADPLLECYLLCSHCTTLLHADIRISGLACACRWYRANGELFREEVTAVCVLAM